MTNLAARLAEWVEKQCEYSTPGTMLPHDAELAESFSLSVSTVRRILGQFHEKGKVCRMKGRGTIVGQPSQPPEPPLPSTSARAVADAIFRRICSGDIRKGDFLPQIKAVTLEFKIGKATAIEAYRMLCRRGYAVKAGKSYKAGAPGDLFVSLENKEIYLFDSAQYPFSSLYTTSRMAGAYKAMENELYKCKYRIIYSTSNRFEELCRQWHRKKRYPHACVFFGISGEEYDALQKPLLSLLDKSVERKPRILFCANYLQNRICGIDYLNFGHINTRICRTIADYFVEKGFERLVACFPHRINDTNIGPINKLFVETKYRAPHARFAFKILTSKPVADQDAFIGQRLFRRSMKSLMSVLGKYEPVTPVQVRALFEATHDREKLFASAGNGDLWVFASDETALEARQYFARRGIKKCEVISLENNPALFIHAIPVCVVDMQTTGYVLAHALIGDIPVARSGSGYIEIPVMLLERRA